MLYFILMLAMLWFWQEASHQFTTRTIAYSEFKALLVDHRVADLTVQQTDITGRVVPKPAANPAAEKETSVLRETNVSKAAPSKGMGAETNVPANVAQGGKAKGNAASPEAYLFRTVRVEDPELVQDLEKAGVELTSFKRLLQQDGPLPDRQAGPGDGATAADRMGTSPAPNAEPGARPPEASHTE